MRVCENCGTKMPFGRRRQRAEKDGPLLCNGCDPNGKGPGEGRPVGHHGSVTASAAKTWDIYIDAAPDKETSISAVTRLLMQVHSFMENEEISFYRSTVLPTSWVIHIDSVDDVERSIAAVSRALQRLHNMMDNGEVAFYRVETNPVGTTAKLASMRDPIRALAMQFVAHDSGDGETIYHCPFCGGGQVTGRSDGTVECGFCGNAFTVQIQPVHPGAPQTIDGQPVEWPGQPEGTFQPDREAQPGAETGAEQPAVPGEAETAPPAEAPGGGPPEERKNKVPPQFANASFVTQAGHVVDVEAYQRHLAIRFADDTQAVLAEVRADRR